MSAGPAVCRIPPQKSFCGLERKMRPEGKAAVCTTIVAVWAWVCWSRRSWDTLGRAVLGRLTDC